MNPVTLPDGFAEALVVYGALTGQLQVRDALRCVLRELVEPAVVPLADLAVRAGAPGTGAPSHVDVRPTTEPLAEGQAVAICRLVCSKSLTNRHG